MTNELEKKIINQIEYYFGDINLPRDKFLKSEIEKHDGWVSIETLLTFNRLSKLCSDADAIANALKNSENDLVEVDVDAKKVRRNPQKEIPELNESRRRELSKRAAYAKGFPPTEELPQILSFLEQHGPFESCIRRTYKKDNEHVFKGSCFIIFKDVETCKKFVEAEEIKYKDINLIRKWQEDYYKEKREELDNLKKNKKEKKLAKQQASDAKEKHDIEFPKGAVLFFDGIEKGKMLTREDIKDKFREIGSVEISYIDFNKGDTEGYIRLPNENGAKEFFEKLTDGFLEIGDLKLKLKVLEGQEEEDHLKKSAEAIVNMRKQQKNNKGRKRKGNFGGFKNSKKGRGENGEAKKNIETTA